MKFKKFKRGIGLFLCMSMVLGGLVGCGGDTSKDGGNGEDNSQYPFHVEDLHGYEFVVADLEAARWEPEEGSSEIANAVINRVQKVEELFNCKISRIDYVEEDAQRAINTGSKYADIAITWTWELGRFFLKARALVNLNDLEGLHLNEEYWTRFGDTNILQYQDYVYAVGAPFASQHGDLFMVFFNKAIVEEIQQNHPELESPYDLYAKDEWTMSKMLEWCRAAKKDLNGDGVFDGNDRYGFAGGHWEDTARVLYMGGGGRFLSEDENGHFTFAMNTKDAFRVVNQVKEIMDPYENAPDLWRGSSSDAMTQTDIVNLFVNGQLLFYAYARGTENYCDRIYDMKDDFGVVPMPKGDNAGPDEYYCWASHNAPSMGIFTNNPDIEKTVMIVEALAYFAQEENEIEENEYLSTKLRDDTAREVVQNLGKYAMTDYVFIGQQMNGDFYNLLEKLSIVTFKDRSQQIMSQTQSIEKAVETAIEDLENTLLQKDPVN